MGLDCSHNAFSGAYGAFDDFRSVVAKAAEVDYWGFDAKHGSGLQIFLFHSGGSEGDWTPEECVKVADDLDVLVPKIEVMETAGLKASGHIEFYGGFAAVTRNFIAGCRSAAASNENLEFC